MRPAHNWSHIEGIGHVSWVQPIFLLNGLSTTPLKGQSNIKPIAPNSHDIYLQYETNYGLGAPSFRPENHKEGELKQYIIVYFWSKVHY